MGQSLEPCIKLGISVALEFSLSPVQRTRSASPQWLQQPMSHSCSYRHSLTSIVERAALVRPRGSCMVGQMLHLSEACSLGGQHSIAPETKPMVVVMTAAPLPAQKGLII